MYRHLPLHAAKKHPTEDWFKRVNWPDGVLFLHSGLRGSGQCDPPETDTTCQRHTAREHLTKQVFYSVSTLPAWRSAGIRGEGGPAGRESLANQRAPPCCPRFLTNVSQACFTAPAWVPQDWKESGCGASSQAVGQAGQRGLRELGSYRESGSRK